jgi:hypothetical protein
MSRGENLIQVRKNNIISGIYFIEIITSKGEKIILKAIKN